MLFQSRDTKLGHLALTCTFYSTTEVEIPSRWKDATRAPPIRRAGRNPSGTGKLMLIYLDSEVMTAAYPKLGVWGNLGVQFVSSSTGRR
jgi:hypothetical protein